MHSQLVSLSGMCSFTFDNISWNDCLVVSLLGDFNINIYKLDRLTGLLFTQLR